MRDRRPATAARHGARPPEERSLTGPALPRFVGSFPRADAQIQPPLPEVALVGRSNVGKSSLLNALAGRRIAKVSATPGKTRMLNVYLMGAGSREPGAGVGSSSLLPAPCSLYYVLDLPGYGWARASQSDRAAFRRLITHTLGRSRLAGVVWLVDARRDPSDEDRDMQDQFAAGGTRILAAITKSDKLPRGPMLRRERELRALLQLDDDQAIVTSARTGAGIGELREAVAELVRGTAA